VQGKVSERTETPLMATLVAAINSGLFALLLDLEALAELVSVGSLFCFLLVNAACVWRRYAYLHSPQLDANAQSLGSPDHTSKLSRAGDTTVRSSGELAAAIEDANEVAMLWNDRDHDHAPDKVCLLCALEFLLPPLVDEELYPCVDN
jgi:hypothetical protein